MGRIRTKGKKLLVTKQDDPRRSEEEKAPAQKRRGRPLKHRDEGHIKNLENEDTEDSGTSGVLDKDINIENVLQHEKTRKKNADVNVKANSIKDEREKGTTDEPNKLNSFRPSGSRRKNKPHRAAEATVECN